MEEMTTTDLSKFGNREKAMAGELLNIMSEKGLPEDFYDDNVTVMMNMSAGNVFLTNSDFQVAMMNDDLLDSLYSCPECGHEGFLEDMEHGSDDEECQGYLQDIGFEKESE